MDGFAGYRFDRAPGKLCQNIQTTLRVMTQSSESANLVENNAESQAVACYSTGEVESLAGRGVLIPAPHQVSITRDVPLDAIAPGAVLHPFTRLSGPATRVDAGAIIGEAGPATLRDTWVGNRARVGALGPVTLRDTTLGPRTVLGCGVAEESVFLGLEKDGADFSTGYGFRVRSGSLYEEDANSAQYTDTKMTILFPWVTLGSNLNWCDILVAGGTGPRAGEFSEIGSGAIHFNFTPRGDKATGSLLGNVVDGVFLRQPRLFIGGNTSIVGPLSGAFGAVAPAGGRFRRGLRAGLNAEPSGAKGAENGEKPGPSAPGEAFDLEIYGDLRRVYASQVTMIGELAALDAWYAGVRIPLAGSDGERAALYSKAREMVGLALAERIRQLGALAARLERSIALLEKNAPGDPRIAQQRALAEQWPDIEAHLMGFGNLQSAPPSSLLEGLDAAAGQGSAEYTRIIRALAPAAVQAGTAWLKEIAGAVAAAAVLERVPLLIL